MRLDTPRARLDLHRHEVARLRQACRTRLDCLDGAAWITLDGDTRDIVLMRGQSFVVDSGANVLVSALTGDAVIDVLPPRRALDCRPARASTLASLASWWARLSPAPRGLAIGGAAR